MGGQAGVGRQDASGDIGLQRLNDALVDEAFAEIDPGTPVVHVHLTLSS